MVPGSPIFYLSDAKERRKRMAKVLVMQGLPILYLSDTKESKEEDGEGRGDAGVANPLPA